MEVVAVPRDADLDLDRVGGRTTPAESRKRQSRMLQLCGETPVVDAASIATTPANANVQFNAAAFHETTKVPMAAPYNSTLSLPTTPSPYPSHQPTPAPAIAPTTTTTRNHNLPTLPH